MAVRPRPELEQIVPVLHGGFDSRRSRELVDFSANVNPFDAAPRVWEAMRHVPMAQHPDPRAVPLRRVVADQYQLDPQQVLIGNGSVELIYHLAVAYLRPGDAVLVVTPTFGEYAAAARIMGAQVIEHRTRAEDNFEINLDAALALVRETQPRLFFLCNPNNPTGVYLSRHAVEELACASSETLFILDEAFLHFVRAGWDARPLLKYDNVLLLRSLTKDYALTGLRVGYALSDSSIIAALEKVQPPWSVNAFAQVAALAALEDPEHLQETLRAIARASAQLQQAIVRLGWRIVPSAVHFFLVEVGDACVFARALLERGFIVRNCASFGLPSFVRIATRTPDENARLVQTLEQLRREAAQ